MRISFLVFFALAATIFSPISGAQAQNGPVVQELNGSLAPGQVDVFLISGLKEGDTLTAFMENTSGNLDPAIGILPASADLNSVLEEYVEGIDKLIASSSQPLLDLPVLRDKTFLAWDEDSGPGYSAAMQFSIKQDGDYFLLGGASLSSAGRQTYGDYRLLIGLNAPQVLNGTAKPTGDVLAVQDQSNLEFHLIQELTGNLNQDKPSVSIKLSDFNPNDTLYVNLQALSGDLKPILILRDYGNKPVQVANLTGQSSAASIQQSFPEGGSKYSLNIFAAAHEGQLASGEYRLLAGLNAPEVLDGEGEPNDQSVLKLPIPVKVGLKLQQIININQPDEIMNDVATLKLEWTDPALAFNPDECNCFSRSYNETSFNQFLQDVGGKWPVYTFFNQQGNRWTQNRLIDVESNGHVTYLERFSTDFQLDFDWAKYPFDRQDFYIKVDMLYPEEDYIFVPMEGFSEISPFHGEDEFVLTTFDTQISSEVSSQNTPVSRFTFHFSAPRYLSYYLFRVIIPILLIISVSYITFFLKDYTRRIEIATGNLLLFIAFSFSLGDNYPRMGYLTFLDVIMAITFAINTLVVLLNVYYKWLETNGEGEKADRLEKPMNYIYPLAYLVFFGIAAWLFLV